VKYGEEWINEFLRRYEDLMCALWKSIRAGQNRFSAFISFGVEDGWRFVVYRMIGVGTSFKGNVPRFVFMFLLPGSLPSSGHSAGPVTSTLPYFMGILGPPASWNFQGIG
jgi:hypothetical protein